MKDKAKWWSLELDGEINDTDREHIAEMIKQGFTSGDIAEDTED